MTQAAVARKLGLTPATVSYHARRLGIDADHRCRRRYDWVEIQRYYDAGHTVTECQARFGFTRKAWYDAVQRGDVRGRPQAMPLEELLSGRRSRAHLKLRLFKLGLKARRCEECGLTTWRGGPLSLELHHVNGDGHDNRLENLQILCPNCHSQTDTWGGRNRTARASSSA
jgi:5-methylcytosine-specific restriction endonuclease McrA